MKLPFDFATKFILRLILPGAILAALLWPAILAVTARLGVVTTDSIRFPIAILTLGWAIMLLDMPLYMAFEGRRFWPKRLRAWGCRREQRRLDGLRDAEASAADPAIAVEYALQTRHFPLGRDGVECAQYPTRLGNLLRAYETYPDRKYGLDGSFVWYRIWVGIDKDLRTEIDDQQAVADSALYVTFALMLGVPILLLYALIRHRAPTAMPMLPNSASLLALGALCALLAWVIYRSSLFAQAQYGEVFAALFDRHAAELRFDALIGDLGPAMDDPALLLASTRERNRAAIRFLKWHRYRKIGEAQNVTVSGY